MGEDRLPEVRGQRGGAREVVWVVGGICFLRSGVCRLCSGVVVVEPVMLRSI